MKISVAIILSLFFLSCTGAIDKATLVGKWAGVFEGEYYEMHIDSAEIHVFSHWQANRGSMQYSIIGDSLYYESYDYSVGFESLSNDLIVLSTTENSDTLCRLNNSILTYDEIDLKDSVEFQDYIKAFYNRAEAHYANIGIHQNNMNDTSDFKPFEEEEMIITR